MTTKTEKKKTVSLWIDKYRPRELSMLDYHKEQASNLQKLVDQGDFPHLLVYGPPGAGKKTRINCLLKELYGPGVEKVRVEHMNFSTPSNKKLEIMTLSSNYHIEMNPSDAGLSDRIVVMELIKNAARFQQLNVKAQRNFKVIVLTEVDQLSRDAQHALRRTMEKYIKNCRLILCANSVLKLTPAIKSRCLGIRVAAPSTKEIVAILRNICKREFLELPDELAERISKACGRNLRRAILMMESAKSDCCPFMDNQKIDEPDWLQFIKDIAKTMLKSQTVPQIADVRSSLYELITHAIPIDIVFKTLLEEILLKCDISLQSKIVAEAAMIEHRMQHGSKDIFHLEAFVTKFMELYKGFLEESLGDVLMM